MVAPTRLPATDGHRGSPSSRFLTLNWSSWSVCLERWARALWGILDQAMRPPGTGQAERGEWDRERRRQRDSVCISVCVHPIICVSSAFCEGTRWGPFTPLWVLEAPCSHFLLSFVTNQVPFSPSSSLLFPSSFPPSFLPPFGAASVHSWLLLLYLDRNLCRMSNLYARPVGC